MSQRVTVTKERLMIDQLAVAATGSDAHGAVEAVLGLNPGIGNELAMAAHELQLGRVVMAPDAGLAQPAARTIKLWD